MSDNVIKSEDVSPKPVKKTAAKKAAPKKAEVKQSETKDGLKIVVFESGASYNSNGLRFTQDNKIQAVPQEDAERLLELDNFRLPTQEEVDNYLTSQEG